MPIVSKTIEIYPSGYIDDSTASILNITNAYTSSDSDTYAQINLVTGSGATTSFYITFDLTEIPVDAVIKNIDCTVKCTVSSIDTSLIGTRSTRLYSGSTAKGTGATISNTADKLSLAAGEWTRDELNDCRLRLYVRRGTSSVTSSQYVRFFGATLLITYDSEEPEEETASMGKVNISGQWKEIANSYVNINGLWKEISRAYVNVNGVWKPIFERSSGTPLGSLPTETIVKMNLGGVPRNFIVVHQGLPSADYDSSCDGTWLLEEDIYDKRAWDSTDNDYENSDVHAYLNGTFLGLFDSGIRSAIKQVKIPYRKGSGSSTTVSSGANGLSAKLFLLSVAEVGAERHAPVEGAVLDYFKSATASTVGYLNGVATEWWLRTPDTVNLGPWMILKGGACDNLTSGRELYGVRPALVLPSDMLVDENMNVIA